jgi:tRNA(adenine34) deaminase
VIYGAPDPKGGALNSHFHLADADPLNHKIEVISGILEEECSILLREFFEARR